MNIVTSANHDFAHCLARLVDSVRECYGIGPIVYDIGLNDEDKKNLDAEIVPIEVAADCFDYSSNGRTDFIRTTHKPACVRHYFEKSSEPMIFVDADCFFAERVEETGFDVGVTLRTGKGLKLSDHFNGVLNAGVILFNTPSRQLVDLWAAECTKENTTDQKALTDILSETIDWQGYNRIYDWHGLKIKVFKTDDYNDYHLRTGKILHFKGICHEQAVYERLLEARAKGKDMYSLYKKIKHRRKRANSWLGRMLHIRAE